jgi:glutamine synthetase
MVRDGRIDTLIVAITDMQGRLMGKRVQAQAFLNGVIDHGAHFCTYLLGTDMEMNTPDGFALMNWETGYGDWIASPVWETLRVLPWLEKTAMVLGDATDEETHAEIPVAPRTILKRQVERAATAGYAVRRAPNSSTTSSRSHGRNRTAAAGPSRSVSATTTRTTTCSRPPRPSRSIGCCATR